MELVRDWRTDRALRRLEAMLLVADAKRTFLLSGTGDLIEPDDDAPPQTPDAHSVDPSVVLQTVRAMGGTVPRARIVGCEPADLSETMGLSEPVARAVEPAMAMIHRLVESEVQSHANAKEDD